VAVPGKAQADLAMFRPVPGVGDPEHYALEIADVVLGQFGMMGRIGDSVRQKQGLAYYAFCSISPGKTQSLWFARAGVDPSKVERATESIREVLRVALASGVTQEELEGTVQLMTGRLALTMQTNAGIAALLQTIAEYDLGLDYVERYPGILARVSREDVQRALAAAIDPDALLVAVAGPDADSEVV
jgi:zinc protease